MQQLPASRLPGAARKVALAQQGQQHIHDLQASAMDHQQPGRLGNNVVTKPQVPAINLGRREGYVATDQALSAKGTGAGALPQVRSGQQSSRAPQHAPEDAIRAQPHQTAETGPITPAQALRRYAEYLTPYEQSEVLQYPQVSQDDPRQAA